MAQNTETTQGNAHQTDTHTDHAPAKAPGHQGPGGHASSEFRTEIDHLIGAFHDGVSDIATNDALQQLETWKQKLTDSHVPELKAVGRDLDSLHKLLEKEEGGKELDGKAIGKAIIKLAEHIEGLTETEASKGVKGRLHTLGRLLRTEGEHLSQG